VFAELVAKLGRDYTVYAPDYSESTTIPSWTGMLSWAQHHHSQHRRAPANQSAISILRACLQNTLRGCFPAVGAETLEVKLRLSGR